MKQSHGWFFPDHEQHLPEWLGKSGVLKEGRFAYQWNKINAALSYVEKKNPAGGRTAVDVGGHIGLWSYYLAHVFDQVHAFEPVAEHRACFELNTKDFTNITLHACALGAPETDDAMVSIHTSKGSSGDSWVNGKGSIPIKRLDSFGLTNVDFIKLDCEGYELFALQGGQQLLLDNKPVVIVEQKPGRAQKFGLKETQAVDYLRALGATLKAEMSGDFILVWE